MRFFIAMFSHETNTFSTIRLVGIDPLAEKILVVKSTIHYRAAFEPIVHTILEVDAPGLSSSNLTRSEFKRVRRPIFPLDDL